MFSIIMLIGLALIVYPQWRDNERLPFPLLTVQKSLFELESKGVFPDILRQKLFWTGAIIILIIHAFRGLHHHTGGAFPDFPVGWGFWGIFTGITRHMNWWVIQGGLIFAIVGITYFVPNRVSFSLWFTVAAYQVYRMVGFEYFAPFHAEPTVKDHRNGLIFMIGPCCLLAWQLWARNSIFYALLAVVMTILTTLVLARIVAETGIPIIPNTVLAHNILQLFPIEWLTAKAIYLTNAMDMLLGPGGSRVSATIAAMHGFGLDQEAKGKNLSRRAIGFIVLIAVGIVICGAVHLYVGYHYSGPLNGRGASVGDYNAISEHMHNPIKDFVPVKSVDEGKRGRILWSSAPHNQILHTIIGFVMAVLLQIACLLSPLWPLHPAGLVIMDTSANDGGILKHIWPSILLGWVIKRCIVVYGGAKAYAYGKPLFLGIILGEVFSSIIWSAVPAILIWMGGDPAEVGHIKVGTR